MERELAADACRCLLGGDCFEQNGVPQFMASVAACASTGLAQLSSMSRKQI